MDLVSNISVGDRQARASDVLGRVYEYFLGQFAAAEGRRGGEFYTASSIVRLLVEMIEPFNGRVFDPCCGSGGMFVQSERFVEEHGGTSTDISIFGQESNNTTWKLCKMNLAIRGVESNIAWNSEGSFHNDAHPDLKADYILANPPFNMSDWGGDRLRDDVRWKYGVPPVGNANYAWIQHFIHHLSNNGTAGFVLANGSLSSNASGEGDIRKAIIEDDLVGCVVALPGQLFYTTQIPVSLWFVTRDKRNSGKRDRTGRCLFIDARQMGEMADRTHRVLTADDIAKIADTYHAWSGEEGAGEYENTAGFCYDASLDDIRSHGHILTPGRYVGVAAEENDGEPFEHKIDRLGRQLETQLVEGEELSSAIRAILGRVRNV